tara:strand:- start:818 stop:1882 length:1065 start_codon:yes stop_codon:yes gene_type:complete
MSQRRQARILDVALEAGVGTATVDRVLNNRSGVSEKMLKRVNEAAQIVNSRGPNLFHQNGKAKTKIFEILLPKDEELSTALFGEILESLAIENGVEIKVSYVGKMDPIALTSHLREVKKRNPAGVAFVAVDEATVSDAVNDLINNGIAVVCISSGLDSSLDVPVVGMDNRAAGRTAGSLLGLFTRGTGKIGLLWGGELYRSHELREIGFRSVIRNEYPQIKILDLVSGGDDNHGNYLQVSKFLSDHPDASGIYSVGGGNNGVIKAVDELSKDGGVSVVAHNLCDGKRKLLMSGKIKGVIHYNPQTAAQLVISALNSQIHTRKARNLSVAIEIILKENIQGKFPQCDQPLVTHKS